ncbi:transcriptional regulator, AraC family protein [Rhodovulum sp. PH10]|uniref:helix-turn-helix domain-containing protein n=1 Tax=Rhodovulum sp. PH10 TaxID=1187851 RepID=UPI00027C2DC9|nr:helix-turn-helix domain-containing protein [Rhodovulum sp. PH10]EJW10528.1 transcriptional regulator, AraC family protein [Rhodovulum sp. PH10]
MTPDADLPVFHLYGEPPKEHAFDVVHVETLVRAARHGWTIAPHRHRDLFQILVIGRGGGEMLTESGTLPFTAPVALLVPATVAHGFRFRRNETEGWVVSFTADVAQRLGDRAGEAITRFRALAADPVVPLGDDHARLDGLCCALADEQVFAREGHRLAMRGCLALLAVGVARRALARPHDRAAGPESDPVVEALRRLIEQHFRVERQLGFYADRLSMTPGRLNEHVKRITGVTAGHLIRQRVVTEAKRKLAFTAQPIHEIGQELTFPDPSHFTRFFRRQTGTTPHEFREQGGG